MNSAQIPVSCPTCGALFASRAFAISGNVKNLTLIGNKETCPNCGEMANIVDGVFDVADNVLSVVKAPQITKEMLKALEVAIREAYEQKRPAEDLAEEVEKIDPSFGEIVRESGKNSTLYVASLLIILAAIRSCSVDVEIDANELIDQMRDAPPTEIMGDGAKE